MEGVITAVWEGWWRCWRVHEPDVTSPVTVVGVRLPWDGCVPTTLSGHRDGVGWGGSVSPRDGSGTPGHWRDAVTLVRFWDNRDHRVL